MKESPSEIIKLDKIDRIKAYKHLHYLLNKQKYLDKASKRYLQNKDSITAYKKDWSKKNADKFRDKRRKERLANPDKIAAQKLASARRCKDHINEYTRAYRKRRLETDIQFKLKMILRKRLSMAITRNFKKGSAVRDLGCSIEELKVHLESKFQPGMTWENYGYRGWHIDHIIPFASFDLTDPEQLRQACYYTNLQPMWAVDNMRKSNKVRT